jgi:O-antigen ligase
MAAPIAPLAVTFAVAVLTFLLAYDGGSFGDTSRGTLAIGAWWIVILAVVAGLWPLARLGRPALVAGGLLAGFAGLTLASVLWADSAEDAFAEFNRASLYLGVFLLAALAGTRTNLVRWLDGLALGSAAVGGLAFFSRCFPEVVAGENVAGLPLDLTRLSYPLGYWNGLAIFLALAVPLLLRLAVSDSHPVLRGLALLPFPVLGADLYLTSSRGGLLTAVLGAVALWALVPRTRTVVAVLLAAAGAAGGMAAVVTRDELVNHPGPAAAGQGHVAFGIVLGACVATAVVAYVVCRFVLGPLEGWTGRVGTVGRATAGAVVVLALAAGIVLSHPVRLFEHFKAKPAYLSLPTNTSNPVKAHLLSVGSSGRWQQWASAVDEFESAPGLGRGAGSFESWWSEHGTLRGYVKDAHSLYLEALGELGIVGFLLIAGAFAAGLAFGLKRAVAARGERRVALAALWAAFLAYAVAAGIDWMWEMTVVSVVGMALLGLMTSQASGDDEAEPRLRRRWNVAARVVLGLAGVTLVLAQALSLLTTREIQASQRAALRGDVSAAFTRADNARKLEPWASSPYEQLALVSEQAGQYGDAERFIGKAIARDRSDWRPWVLSVRFEAALEHIAAARRGLREVCRLNPRSPQFDPYCPARAR